MWPFPLCALISTNYITVGSQVLCLLVGFSKRKPPAGYGRVELYRRWINDHFSSLPVQLWFSYWLCPLPNSTAYVVQVLSNGYSSHCSVMFSFPSPFRPSGSNCFLLLLAFGCCVWSLNPVHISVTIQLECTPCIICFLLVTCLIQHVRHDMQKETFWFTTSQLPLSTLAKSFPLSKWHH